MNKLAFISDPVYWDHLPESPIPEKPERLSAIEKALKNKNLWSQLTHYSPRPATKDDLLLVHKKELVEFNLAQDGKKWAQLEEDTILSQHSIKAALKAAGAGLDAVDLIFKDSTYKRVFAAVRPPGHHAEWNRSMGFCVFNNVAVAAAYAIKNQFVKKALIIDWDVHHGNGVQDIFYSRNDVYYLSLHQHPLYPGTGFPGERGAGSGEGFNLNKPLSAGRTDDEYFQVLDESLKKIEENFSPDIIFISAGFDAHNADPLGGMKLTEQGYAKMTKQVTDFAEKHCDGRIISMLEGGYDLDGMANSVAEHILTLLDN